MSSRMYILVLFMSIHSVFGCDDCYVKSRATYYGSTDCLGTVGGACGYGVFGRNLNAGDVAGVAQLYRNGTGCGACYQLRCTNEDLCTGEGNKIVVTDYGQGDRTDFILSLRAYSRLARAGKSYDLVTSGVVEIEFKRISCSYPGYNLMFKVDESSNYPDYLALLFWYQAGRRDMIAVELSCDQGWKAMCRNHGGVWDMVIPPRGALYVRFLMSDGYKSEWVYAKNPIPANWGPGTVYDSGIQTSD